MDNLFSEKQQRLLTRSLYSSTDQLTITQPFLAAANVGIFYGVRQPPIVPDVFLSLGVEVAEDWYAKEHRSYFVWEFDKLPELALEIVSNRIGGELEAKKRRYATIGIPYYVVYDPQRLLSQQPLQCFELTQRVYQPLNSAWFAQVGLGLRLWDGVFEGKHGQWLRWYDEQDSLVLTGEERAKQAEQQLIYEQQAKYQAEQRASQAEQQIIQEQQAKYQAEHRAARYLAKLQALGISLEDAENE